MKKYLNIFYNNAATPPVLINASNIMMIKQGSVNTTTEIIYNADADADTIVLTHAADAGFLVQNFLVAEVVKLMSSSYTNAAPLIMPPLTVSAVALGAG